MSALSEPLRLPCGAELGNRLAKAAMSEQLATPANGPTAELVRLYGRWADSGAGLLLTGNVAVDRTALSEPLNVSVEDERDLDLLRAWAESAAAGGAQVWMQVNHAGRQSPRYIARRPVAPSAVGVRGLGGTFGTPRELTGAEIEGLVERFAVTAGIAVRAGFGGVQVHAAHGYLISQFLSPSTNLRSDGWGGDPVRRRRFLVEVVRAVRAAVGPGTPVSVKLNSADFQRGGLDWEESLEVAGVLEEERVDLLEISGGTYESPELLTGRQSTRRSTREREAYFLEFAEKVRARSAIPLMLTGGFRTRAGMEEAIGGGAVDVVGLARPMALDPGLPARVLAGEDVVSGVEPRRVGVRRLDGMSELAWHTEQLWRVGRGGEPDPGRHPLRSVLAYAAVSGRDALRRGRIRARR
ncbi:NADH:flavin oxidoreductase/NADH oxidase family protein [Spirillospora sp. NPDC047279]|uniref:NADH:flavin oxidoreductase/NADH oxidase family protein n=1 Tax=Spirillospora sp. NPDC047279 TaxID=3155478 RepID=UPI0033F465F0